MTSRNLLAPPRRPAAFAARGDRRRHVQYIAAGGTRRNGTSADQRLPSAPGRHGPRRIREDERDITSFHRLKPLGRSHADMRSVLDRNETETIFRGHVHRFYYDVGW